jgi:arylsulfatase/uncharacterized sulfatase
MKNRIRWAAIATGLLLLAATPLKAQEAPERRPNIVLILADDLGFTDLEHYGSEISTPNISALAAEGISFTNYHTAASCAPTRAMLLTGVDSHRNGVPNIPEAIPPEQFEHENYQGVLSHKVVTVASMLKQAGYHTYMAGKWHLGKTPDLLPFARGFERTITMADTGADNWEQKPYLPIYAKANWYADGKEHQLPDDFYSSKYFVDKTIEFIDSNQSDDQPFFAYVPFQAVHMPVQAPREFTQKYIDTYAEGWTKMRENRRLAAIEKGIVPDGTQTIVTPGTRDWDALSEEEKRYEAKRMAVYAGMVDAMDMHIGRLVAHLKAIGEYDNTIFIFTSDNGAEGADPIAMGKGSFFGTVFNKWMDKVGYNDDYETLGEKGSFVTIGASNATVAASPLAFYKFYTGEGGMRVPLIISGPGIANKGGLNDALIWVTDLTPTILGLANVAVHDGTWNGKTVEPVIGKALTPLLSGETQTVRGPDDVVGYELGGHRALLKGDHKIVLNRITLGDGQWHLFNIKADPGETRDLATEQPERFAAMLADWDVFAAENNVLPVTDDYVQQQQVANNGMKQILITLVTVIYPGELFTVLFILGLVVWLGWRRRSRA